MQDCLIPKFLTDMSCLKESDMDSNLFGQDHFYMSEKKVVIDSAENKAIIKSRKINSCNSCPGALNVLLFTVSNLDFISLKL